MDLYRTLVRPLLFSCDAEWIHNRTLDVGAALGATHVGRILLRALFEYNHPSLHCTVAGLHFANPLGLAAGLDKNGRAVRALDALGFGSVEVGSVSAYPSVGNAKPRLFRLPADEAIIVNYGVPNGGAQAVSQRMHKRSTDGPLGVNLVETNTGQGLEDDAVIEEFVEAVRPFCSKADYVTLNLNCPNTTGGSSPFDSPDVLRTLMLEYGRIRDLPPVFLKFTAHADGHRMENTLSAIEGCSFVRGFIFNLPPGANYPLRSPAHVVDPMPGTLCGPPTQDQMNRALRFWYRHIDRQRHVIIGSGGVRTAEDAYEKIRLGASLVQIYTALVYRGPGLVQQINRGLVRLLERDGLEAIGQAVGLDNDRPQAL